MRPFTGGGSRPKLLIMSFFDCPEAREFGEWIDTFMPATLALTLAREIADAVPEAAVGETVATACQGTHQFLSELFWS